jgi:uncharacterized protein (TIGR02117 family)
MRQIFRWLAGVLLIPLGVYLGAMVVLGHWPVNRDWQQPASGITIYVETNGVHSAIIVPANAAGVDWRQRVRAEDLPDPHQAGQWLAFGWGDRDFYINTPTWAQFSLPRAVGAMAGLGSTLIHVDHLDRVVTDPTVRMLRLTPPQYRRLAAFIGASFAPQREVIHGYGTRDVFYAAQGHYSALRTCNVWTGDALRIAGVKTALWSPTDAGVMRWLPAP